VTVKVHHTGFSVNGRRRRADVITNSGTPAEKIVGTIRRKRDFGGYEYTAAVAGVVIYVGPSIVSALERIEAHLEQA